MSNLRSGHIDTEKDPCWKETIEFWILAQIVFHKGMLILSGYPEVTGCTHTKHLCKWPKSKAEQHFTHLYTEGNITTHRLEWSFSMGSWFPYAQTHLQWEPTSTTWRRKWQPTAVFLPGKFHAQRSLAGYSPWGCKESNMTEHAHADTPLWGGD